MCKYFLLKRFRTLSSRLGSWFLVFYLLGFFFCLVKHYPQHLLLLKVLPTRYCNFTYPACFSLPRVEYGALVCSDPQAHYVLDADGKPELVHEEEEDEVDNQNEVLEMVSDTVEAETVNIQEELAEVQLDQAMEELNKLTVQEE